MRQCDSMATQFAPLCHLTGQGNPAGDYKQPT